MRVKAPSLPRSVRGSDDLLSVNELHEGRSRPLMQVKNLSWSYEVDAGRQGCCTYLLYRSSAVLQVVSNATLVSAPSPKLPGSQGEQPLESGDGARELRPTGRPRTSAAAGLEL